MYELKRAKKISEQIKIGDEIITVDLDAEQIAMEFNKRRNDLIAAEQKIKTIKDTDGQRDDVFEEYASAVTSLFNLIFGEENTLKIIEFYENRFLEMSTEVFPFIVDAVVPQINQTVAELQEKAKKRYIQGQASKFGLNRKQRRMFGL